MDEDRYHGSKEEMVEEEDGGERKVPRNWESNSGEREAPSNWRAMTEEDISLECSSNSEEKETPQWIESTRMKVKCWGVKLDGERREVP